MSAEPKAGSARPIRRLRYRVSPTPLGLGGSRMSCLHLMRPGERPLPYHGAALARGQSSALCKAASIGLLGWNLDAVFGPVARLGRSRYVDRCPDYFAEQSVVGAGVHLLGPFRAYRIGPLRWAVASSGLISPRAASAPAMAHCTASAPHSPSVGTRAPAKCRRVSSWAASS